MPMLGFDDLFAAADSLVEPIPVVAIGGAEPTVLEALATARFRGWVEPTVTGDAGEIARVASEVGLDIDGVRIIDTNEPARAAVAEVRGGRARLLMKGQVSTPDLMRAVLDRENGLRTGRTICQIVLMDFNASGRRLLLSDTGVTVDPTVEQRIEIVESVADVARRLGAEPPRIALMAATEKPTDAMPDTVESAEIARRCREEGLLPGCFVDGPLSFDLALATDAAGRKGVDSEVAGAVDGAVFPDLRSANLVVKALMYLADCRFGGLLAGVACPVVFMSRADSVETRLNSLAYALHVAAANKA